MYTIQENVRIVIALLKQYNIKYMVLSPGGTNIPLVHAVQNDPFFTCYSIPDERSAMYFAIGLYLQTGEIVATSCTSAQATRNYLPGLTEAYYKHVPILAITTSKLERFQYQDYMQAPDQCSLPRDTVKKSFDMPPVTDDNTRVECFQKAKEAILELTHRCPGPVQINIRIVDSQQGKFEEVQLPNVRIPRRYMAWEDWTDIDLREKKILIVVGEHRPFTARQKSSIDMFCKSYDVAVYVNHLSNFSNEFSIHANLLISSGDFSELKPDILISIGGQTGDYSAYGVFNRIGNSEHWRVSEDGSFVDTYCHLTKIFECPDYFFFERLAKPSFVEHSYYESWKALNETMNYGVDVPFSNLYIAQQLYKEIPNGSIMNFAILNSLRCWSYFPLHPSIECYANVAAFGIDGCNSMLIGESMNTDSLCFIVTGDLAFFYDMNALGIRHIKNNVRILLVNNHGGAEFRFMTRTWEYKHDVGPFTSAEGHNGQNARGWAENCGFNYLSASNKDDFKIVKNIFLSQTEKPQLLEVFTDGEDEKDAIKQFLEGNRIYSKKDRIKNVVSKIVGDKGVAVIRDLIRK